jgi:hypothetical protein
MKTDREYLQELRIEKIFWRPFGPPKPLEEEDVPKKESLLLSGKKEDVLHIHTPECDSTGCRCR